jgi:hypothetical protein
MSKWLLWQIDRGMSSTSALRRMKIEWEPDSARCKRCGIGIIRWEPTRKYCDACFRKEREYEIQDSKLRYMRKRRKAGKEFRLMRRSAEAQRRDVALLDGKLIDTREHEGELEYLGSERTQGARRRARRSG